MIGRLAGAFGVYLLLALALTFPLILQMGSLVPHDPGDPLFNSWVIWWNAQHAPLSTAWWNGPFFHPAEGTLAFSEHLIGLLPITAPIQWLGGGPLLAYNTALLLSFPLSAFTMHLLCYSLTRRHDLALVGGLAYGFAPYRMGAFSHLQTLSSYYIPLVFLGLHGFLRSRKTAWLALFAGGWLMQSLCNGYYLFFVAVLVALWLAWFARDLALLARIGAAWAVAALLLGPILVPYLNWHAHYGFSRIVAEAERFSADVLSFFRASPWLALWQPLAIRWPTTWLFPGLTLPAVMAIAIFRLPRGAIQSSPLRSRLRVAMAAGALLFATAALSAALLGPWKLRALGLSISVTALHKPLAIAFTLLLGIALTADRFVDAFRRSSAIAFYLAAWAAMGLLALGPSPTLLGVRIWDKAPYWWLMQLPGLSGLRQPTRFAMLGALCLALAAVLALQYLLAPQAATSCAWPRWSSRCASSSRRWTSSRRRAERRRPGPADRPRLLRGPRQAGEDRRAAPRADHAVAQPRGTGAERAGARERARQASGAASEGGHLRLDRGPDEPLHAGHGRLRHPAPAGEAYFAVEGANGELGFYVVSDGTDRPYRVRCRPPCLPPVAALPA